MTSRCCLRITANHAGLSVPLVRTGKKIAANALRCSVDDPLVLFPKLDLCLEFPGILEHGNDSQSRELVWKILGLPAMLNRHDALADAHDVKRILDTAREYCKDFISGSPDHQPLRK